MQRYNRSYTSSLFLAVLVMTVFSACEDPVPSDFIPQNVVEGFLFVDQPIESIRIHRSQQLTDSFFYSTAVIRDADVRLIVNNRILQLEFRPDSVEGGFYYFPDTTEKVLPNTTYDLDIRLSDGSTITGRTHTPARSAWIRPPREVLQYPLDTLQLFSPDSIGISWTEVPGVENYLISAECLDTLNYGLFLDPPTEETNRRIYRFFEEDAPRFDEVVRIFSVTDTDSPVGWFIFKWFGRHNIRIYAPDENMWEWFLQTHRGESPRYDELLNSIQGAGIGLFGSASFLEQKSFIIKNQP